MGERGMVRVAKGRGTPDVAQKPHRGLQIVDYWDPTAAGAFVGLAGPRIQTVQGRAFPLSVLLESRS